jgi:hypothetical protein
MTMTEELRSFNEMQRAIRPWKIMAQRLEEQMNRYRECLLFILAEADFENPAEETRIHTAINHALHID